MRETAAEADGEELGDLELTLRMPLGRVEDVLATFTRQEKCDAVAAVLQQRLDAALELRQA